jgi:hypothetical protein
MVNNDGNMVNMDASNFENDAPEPGLPGNFLEGGAEAFNSSLSIGEAASYLVMQAKDSVTFAIYTWVVQYPDMVGRYYPGPNSPTEIAIRSIYDYQGRREAS